MAEYACACLNVRIRPQPTDGTPPELEEPDYQPVYVGENGISVAHRQLTLRTRTRARPDSQTHEALHHRHTALTCLNCQTTVYRVFQSIPLDMIDGVGPVLPTEEWVEQEVLKSTSGWIELSKGVLSGDAVTKAAASSSYSPVFDILLPAPSVLPPVIPLYTPPPSPPPRPEQPVAVHSHLPQLPPLFPPIPFSPSHQVFRHLSFLATEQSQTIRHAAEEHIAKVTEAKVQEIKQEEGELRRQVQLLWTQFREAEIQIEQQAKAEQSNGRVSRDSSTGSNGKARSGSGTPVAIVDFIPVPSPRPRVAAHMSPRTPSALSTSLATTSFHHPKANAEEDRRTAVPPRPGISAATTAGASSPHEGSHETLREAFKRNMSEDIDIATSFKYVVDIEAEMARAAKTRGRQGRHSTSPTSPPATVVSAPAVASQPFDSGEGPSNLPSTPPRPRAQGDATGPETPSPRSKAKRKVTFDIQSNLPARAHDDVNKGTRSSRDQEAEIFDLEDDDGDAPRGDSKKLTLPLMESLHMPNRPQRQRSTSGPAGLPQSLSSLRPASLPAPSALRVSTSEAQLLSPKADSKTSPNGTQVLADEEVLSPRETELARLVAATTPSHRNAWKKDSKAWKLFTSRPSYKDSDAEDDRIDEENDASSDIVDLRANTDGATSDKAEWSQTMAASLPITIGPISQPRKNAGFAPTLADNQELDVPPVASSVALRKAAYADRDRERSMDPGALDFEAGEDDEDDDKDDETEVGSRGRRNALKILKARSELPAEGMWRSLAT
ncbi:hypothetical protein BV25DRAFT_1986271 [Artomyces pyxidatus]|uniref:Uncharacterized protein n=1 Tax=Artomyces pyxidatus TaxID=48021 RepID=A0ACB8TJQ3_9AGAM|nr:hypothetical protein BV25DRAFT_1986271 [Artomyces pyxidatus]